MEGGVLCFYLRARVCVNVGPAGTLPRAAFNWRDPTVLAAVGQLGGSFDDVGESAQAWPAPARFGEEAPTE